MLLHFAGVCTITHSTLYRIRLNNVLKFKIDFYNDEFLSEVYHKTPEGNIKCELNDMDDVKQCIPYKSEIKVIFKINKIWFMSKNYGCQLKLVKVLVNSKKI